MNSHSKIFIAASAAALLVSAVTAQTLTNAWYFESGATLEDSVGTADLTSAPGGSAVTFSGGNAVFDGTGLLSTGALGGGGLLGGSGSTFSVEMIFTLDAIPTTRTALFGEVAGFSNDGQRGIDVYTESTGNTVTQVGTSNTGQNGTFAISNAAPPGTTGETFELAINTRYHMAVVFDFSAVNTDNANFETITVTYILDDLTNNVSYNNIVSRDIRTVAGGPDNFGLGGRLADDGTFLNAMDGEIEALAVWDGAVSSLNLSPIPEPSTYALLGGLLALASVMLRRRR